MISSLEKVPSLIFGRVAKIEITIVVTATNKKMIDGMVKYGASESLRSSTLKITEMIIELTEIRMLAL